MSRNRQPIAKLDRRLLASWVRSFRAQHKLTQAQLAEILGISRTHMSRIERSVCEPSPAIVFALVELMNRREQMWLLFLVCADYEDILSRFNYGYVGEMENV